MFTYNTMQTFIGVLGLEPLHMISPTSDDPRRTSEFPDQLVDCFITMASRGIRPRDIVTPTSLRNALTVAIAMGGSTNVMLHIVEIALAAGYRTESEHLESVLTATFGRAVSGPWGVADRQRDLDSENLGLERSGIRMLTAPSSRPGWRADNGDAIQYLADRVPPPWRRSVLVVTSAIYVPYQFLVIAPLLLAEGSQRVEVVGTPTSTDGPPALLAQRVAQEVHATIVTLALQLGPI